jgi:hypothetical protein
VSELSIEAKAGVSDDLSSGNMMSVDGKISSGESHSYLPSYPPMQVIVRGIVKAAEGFGLG